MQALMQGRPGFQCASKLHLSIRVLGQLKPIYANRACLITRRMGMMYTSYMGIEACKLGARNIFKACLISQVGTMRKATRALDHSCIGGM